MKMILAVCLLALPAAADEFKAIKASDSVTYPLPPMPLPAVASSDSGKWSETEDSPALRVSRAWVKLGQAAGVERSDATKRLFAAWKSENARSGPHSRVAQASYARFLAAYKSDLEKARGIYEGVLRDVDAMDDNGDGEMKADGTQGGLAKDADEQIKAADRDDRLTNSACFLSPDTCQQSDPTDKALQDEIAGLVRDTLEAGGPDGGLSLYALKRKASLLALRAKVMGAVTQRAAARLATEVATQGDGQSSPKALPLPISNLASASSKRAVNASDPYR
ncbi:MAG TPA: hypothetical protein VH083_09505 [Myxococcales bacterium]|nr:hypothetical protein [Myxococcales bacterium]